MTGYVGEMRLRVSQPRRPIRRPYRRRFLVVRNPASLAPPHPPPLPAPSGVAPMDPAALRRTQPLRMSSGPLPISCHAAGGQCAVPRRHMRTHREGALTVPRPYPALARTPHVLRASPPARARVRHSLHGGCSGALAPTAAPDTDAAAQRRGDFGPCWTGCSRVYSRGTRGDSPGLQGAGGR
jgi:hypothetical protein